MTEASIPEEGLQTGEDVAGDEKTAEGKSMATEPADADEADVQETNGGIVDNVCAPETATAVANTERVTDAEEPKHAGLPDKNPDDNHVAPSDDVDAAAVDSKEKKGESKEEDNEQQDGDNSEKDSKKKSRSDHVKDKDRDRKSKDKDRDRERDRDRDRHKDRDRERDRERERDRDRERDRKNRHKSRDRKDRRRSYSRSKSRSRDRKRSRRSPTRSRSRGKTKHRSRSRSKDRRNRHRSSRSRDDRRKRKSRSRSRRRSRSTSADYGGYVPRKRTEPPREGGKQGFSTSYIDPYSSLRTVGVIESADPQEMAKQLQEQQLRARQQVLQQQAASAVAAASKTQREVYVGNLVAGLVTEDALRQLFNSAMSAALPEKCPAGFEPVVNVSMHSEGRYAFVELRSPEMATAALQLSGQVQLLGQPITVGRPSGYVDPAKALAAAQTAALALAQFQAQQLNPTEVTYGDDGIASHPTALVAVEKMVSAQTLFDSAQYQEVLSELKEECNKYGMVLRVFIPRPQDPSTAYQVFGTNNYGRAFVQFLDAEGATKTKEAISGRLFDGNAVQVNYIHPEFYLKLTGAST